MGFTKEELEAMRLADEEIDREFSLSVDDIAAYNELDRAALYDRKGEKERELTAQLKAYREANKDNIAAQRKVYYEANRENINEKRRRNYREKRIRNQDGV